ncbi:hypothetical protein AA103196_2197 [Ameyamaea chiangmaiensis NBRC 103196]|uniref:Glycosyltransferase n=1 Tax=Ameyamaea chiangmaiensis TaxID=442969 RepID=A0A850PB13_9PROT|nr:hypothetical protein [Ameyamaea chiangmaiensis]MBS4075543.1 hypothetical protein [Ameyamaea chiangmaiensis]NVN41264.1 hypothetical protein [Ameyamaea chiangmaiensis]GBQ69379.1 hypothetical protein AA103196_2197 [Ameyamaea chiangmaiensis NBRC 103196]
MNEHVFIATPCFGGLVTQSYMQSVLGCMAEAGGMGFTMTLSLLGQDALITRCRNTLAHQFLTVPHATHLLFIDSDIGFRAADIRRLLDTGRDVTGALYPLKERYWGTATEDLVAAGEDWQSATLRYVGESGRLYEQTEATVAEVAYAGTGFLMISRTALLRMIEAYPETRYARIDAPEPGPAEGAIAPHALFDSMIDPVSRTYLSEDFAFCARWRAIGGSIWLDRSINLTHTGPCTFGGRPIRRAAMPTGAT